jgi:hypothetical protein
VLELLLELELLEPLLELEPLDVLVVPLDELAAVVAVPVNGIVNQLSLAFESTPTYPFDAPATVGLYVAVTVAVYPAGIVAGSLLTENGPLNIAVQQTDTLAPPVFLI